MRLIQKGYLQVSKIHSIYYELRGKKNGVPAVFLHGGPGSQFKSKHFKSFPQNHCVLFFDQRGCGRSKPLGELKENNTQNLVNDIKVLMEHVGFTKAKIVGGSWGSTLALCFAIRHPERVKKLVLSGVYLGTKEEANRLLKTFELFSPQFFEEAQQTPTFFKKHDAAMIKRLHLLEGSIMDNSKTWKENKSGALKKSDWLEPHYLLNNCFLPSNYIMKNVGKIANIPAVIIQGQQDLVCPPVSAWNLSKKFKRKKLIIVASGHHMPNIAEILKKRI